MREAWVYIDESHEPYGAGNPNANPFWLGALVTPVPISTAVVEEALKNLSKDPDVVGNAQDEETARRGYFHASFDSKNAHSWFCRSIVQGGVQAAFFANQWFFNRDDSENLEGTRLHRLSTLLGTSFVLGCDFDAIHFAIATRFGSFEPQQVDEWPAYCRKTGLEALVDMPQMPVRFPQITAVASDGQNPGVQVCDFVLWGRAAREFCQERADGETRLGRASQVVRLGFGWAS